ncbi:MAG: type III-A CRISPR-associated protein Csm2, partial [Bacteroidota bacterium]
MSELKPEFQKALSNMAEISPETIVRIAQDQGSHYQSKRIKTNQIRNFYGEVNAMKLEFRTSQDLPKLSRR